MDQICCRHLNCLMHGQLELRKLLVLECQDELNVVLPFAMNFPLLVRKLLVGGTLLNRVVSFGSMPRKRIGRLARLLYPFPGSATPQEHQFSELKRHSASVIE